MTTLSKIIVGVALIGAILGTFAFFNLTPFRTIVQNVIAGSSSPVGTTFNTAKIVSVNMTPSTPGATTTSILNTDASDRWFANYGMAVCTGVQAASTSVATLTVQAATTTVANLGLQGNANYMMNLTISTSTSISNSATSTQTNPVFSLWPSGTYITFAFNATDTAACTVEMDYLAS